MLANSIARVGTARSLRYVMLFVTYSP